MPFMSLKFIKTNLCGRTRISLDVCIVFFFYFFVFSKGKNIFLLYFKKEKNQKNPGQQL